jgi:hypothetical protein
MMAMAEQLRVSHLGIDNTIEAILMGAIAGIQVLLFALGAAGVRPLAIFNNTEFLMLNVISMTQAVVAILIKARTLRRRSGSATTTSARGANLRRLPDGPSNQSRTVRENIGAAQNTGGAGPA